MADYTWKSENGEWVKVSCDGGILEFRAGVGSVGAEYNVMVRSDPIALKLKSGKYWIVSKDWIFETDNVGVVSAPGIGVLDTHDYLILDLEILVAGTSWWVYLKDFHIDQSICNLGNCRFDLFEDMEVWRTNYGVVVCGRVCGWFLNAKQSGLSFTLQARLNNTLRPMDIGGERVNEKLYFFPYWGNAINHIPGVDLIRPKSESIEYVLKESGLDVKVGKRRLWP